MGRFCPFASSLSPSLKKHCPRCSQSVALFKAHSLGCPLKSSSKVRQWMPNLCSPPCTASGQPRGKAVPVYLGCARVLLIQQVVLPALVLVLLVIDLQLLPDGFHAVLLHHLVLPYTEPPPGPAPALQQPLCEAAGPTKPHQSCRLAVTPHSNVPAWGRGGTSTFTKGLGMDEQMPLASTAEASPAGTWRWGRAAWCPAWRCTGRVTRAGNG